MQTVIWCFNGALLVFTHCSDLSVFELYAIQASFSFYAAKNINYKLISLAPGTALNKFFLCKNHPVFSCTIFFNVPLWSFVFSASPFSPMQLYLVQVVQTCSVVTFVEKSFDQFSELHSNLQKQFPSHALPE